MSEQNDRTRLVARRGELMAELFLQELEPQFLSRPTSPDVGYDLLVGFLNSKNGINTFAVEVKATERLAGKRYPLPRRTLDRFARSNIPGLLLVADVKENRLYYGWLTAKAASATTTVSIPLVEVNPSTQQQLRQHFKAANLGVVA